MQTIKLDIYGQSLEESTSSRLSLPKVKNEFFQYNRGAIKAATSPDEADRRYPMLVKKLNKYVQEFGYDAKLTLFQGYKQASLEKPSVALKGVKLEELTHAVVLCTQICLDVCKLRLGSSYFEPFDYSKSHALREYWQRTIDVSHLSDMSVDEVKRRMASFKQAHRHAPGGDARGSIGMPHERNHDYNGVDYTHGPLGKSEDGEDFNDDVVSSAGGFIQLSTVERDQLADLIDARFKLSNLNKVELVSVSHAHDNDPFGIYDCTSSVIQVDQGVYLLSSKDCVCRLYTG